VYGCTVEGWTFDPTGSRGGEQEGEEGREEGGREESRPQPPATLPSPPFLALWTLPSFLLRTQHHSQLILSSLPVPSTTLRRTLQPPHTSPLLLLPNPSKIVEAHSPSFLRCSFPNSPRRSATSRSSSPSLGERMPSVRSSLLPPAQSCGRAHNDTSVDFLVSFELTFSLLLRSRILQRPGSRRPSPSLPSPRLLR